MNPRHAFVAARASHRCEHCHAPGVIHNFPFEIEHVIPVSRGGDDTEANWALACRSCNLRKSAFRDGIDPESGLLMPLFHPRFDLWDDHFRAEELGAIAGLTPIGRATLARLQLNGDRQAAARRLWARLGLFP